ncbi:hypothetical protein CEXT_664681 [Caerostris extrusa]|uniref:Uncharacterized protein n=1 Tax=Caerostris extrusa TaxID=172846 RepID=A0AAV4PXR0_CAEEX|nr:hypothetical protein CEXT_664681 [Caerostris extrusa]
MNCIKVLRLLSSYLGWRGFGDLMAERGLFISRPALPIYYGRGTGRVTEQMIGQFIECSVTSNPPLLVSTSPEHELTMNTHTHKNPTFSPDGVTYHDPSGPSKAKAPPCQTHKICVTKHVCAYA